LGLGENRGTTSSEANCFSGAFLKGSRGEKRKQTLTSARKKKSQARDAIYEARRTQEREQKYDTP